MIRYFCVFRYFNVFSFFSIISVGSCCLFTIQLTLCEYFKLFIVIFFIAIWTFNHLSNFNVFIYFNWYFNRCFNYFISIKINNNCFWYYFNNLSFFFFIITGSIGSSIAGSLLVGTPLAYVHGFCIKTFHKT